MIYNPKKKTHCFHWFSVYGHLIFAEVIEVITSSMLCLSAPGEAPDRCFTGARAELLDRQSVVGSLRTEKHTISYKNQ